MTAGALSRRLAAQVVLAGFHGTGLPEWVALALRSGLAGIVLHRRNVDRAAQVAALAAEARRVAPDALVAIDHEGGRVQWLGADAGFTAWPAPRRMAAQGGPDEVRAAAAAMGRELRAVGVDLVLGPVLDVATDALNPVMEDRAFATDPLRVAALALAAAEGFAQAGVLTAGKHYPGHGDARLQPAAAPRLPHDRARLDAVELVPFRAAARARFPALVAAHLAAPALGDDLPASLSPAALRVLRAELGFDGCIATDDLESASLTAFPAAPVEALRAGADLLVFGSRMKAVADALGALAAEATIGGDRRARLEDAAERVAALRARVEPPEPLSGTALANALRLPEALSLAARLGGGR
ncbi:MAG TPA: glycoside hydrolase family 3 N-terminal domain-containing protein [Myxococcota bacterium]|nr:glycoside hydrolase family 3 N-terminal domain-containing protein [Myxococcota bacterium]